MSYDICVVSGSRAEYDLLKPLLKRICDDSDFDLSFVLTGSHLDERFGNTGGEIDKGPVPVAERIPLLSVSDDKHGMAKAIASAVSGFSDYFERHSFDLLLILGDGVKRPSPSEARNMEAARKSIVALRDIKKGELLTEENIMAKRPANGISPMRWFEVIGTEAIRDFMEDEPIEL